jgi:two-component system, chemotaxis family, CheB/CheR fusion protein
MFEREGSGPSMWGNLVKGGSASFNGLAPASDRAAELALANEELRLLNDQVVAAHQELESTNGELTRVNAELARRNLEFSRINGDLHNLIAAIDVPVVIVNTEGRIRRFTPRARSLLGLHTNDVGRPLADSARRVLGVCDLDQQLAGIINGLGVRESEVRDRGGRWHRLQIRPYKATDGRIEGAVVSLIDIDALRQSVADAVAARTEAERANGAKDQFLATLSHELRTPLTSILVNAQLLLEKEPDPAQRRRAYEAIVRGTRFQKQLIDDLLDVSGIVSGKTRMEMRTVELRAVVSAALDQVRLSAERKELTLESDLQPVGMVTGDPGRLEQVASNLLSNAIKFTPSGGRVRVALAGEAGDALLTVTDNGVGIDPAFLPQVFERFSQADSTATRAHGGRGIGLTIVRHLVEMHGGTVSAASAGPGTGARFTVRLPRLRAREERAAPVMGGTLPAPGAAPSAPRPRTAGWLAGPHLIREPAPYNNRYLGRVLVVDDDRDTREAVAEMLVQAGAQVRVADSTTAALQAFSEFGPSLILSDIAMPGEDGCGLLRRIRSLGSSRGGDVPAIALTALAREDDRTRALAAGFHLFMSKPVDMNQLRQVVLSFAGDTVAQENNR